MARALQLYALERLPFLKGARQEANRINFYLRAAGLEIIMVSKPSKLDAVIPGIHWEVSLISGKLPRKTPNSLQDHRQRQEDGSVETHQHMRQLARTPMAEITAYLLQELINAMMQNGYKAATIALERALLRRLFNFAKTKWYWIEPQRNPAAALDMPSVDNMRSCVLSNAEWRRISEALEKARNRHAALAIALLLETAMRASEPLVHARWSDVDWMRCVLNLQDAKAGSREVPLTPTAMTILAELDSIRSAGDVEAPILPITYEAVRAVWKRACVAAGVSDVRIHDLRHTAATRFSLELNGNLPLLKVITGHKTYSQLLRYINVKAEDVARLLNKRPLTADSAPAGLHVKVPALVQPSMESPWSDAELPEKVIPFKRPAQIANAG